MSKLSQLHDASLSELSLNWSDGTFIAKLRLGRDSHEVRIVGRGITACKYNREFPWGKSVSVNVCEITVSESNSIMKIEMQSGDEIVCIGTAFTVS